MTDVKVSIYNQTRPLSSKESSYVYGFYDLTSGAPVLYIISAMALKTLADNKHEFRQISDKCDKGGI